MAMSSASRGSCVGFVGVEALLDHLLKAAEHRPHHLRRRALAALDLVELADPEALEDVERPLDLRLALAPGGVDLDEAHLRGGRLAGDEAEERFHRLAHPRLAGRRVLGAFDQRDRRLDQGVDGSEQALLLVLRGGITPRALPRHSPAPVAVHLAGSVLTSDRAPLPRVNWIRLELAWRGTLDTRGLAVCPRIRLLGAPTWLALKHCGDALVGRGRLFARVFVPNQSPFDVRARLVAFNGRTKGGRHAVLVHAYATHPPVSFVIPFSVHHQKGAFRTVLVALIRRSAGPWPHVANFQISISRNFSADGKRRSYLSASCPVPEHFTAGFLSLARATYYIEGGQQLSIETVRSCRAR